MTLHWWHVLISYALTAAVFGGLALGAAARHRAARRMLAALDPRGDRP
jgi:heme exporter protein CcmD